ncbi:MAG: AlpA family transcriptional regulator [Oceanospirillum sp.]|nr:AlpA family transcriptional regulator [Oceanospirillum sp.]
MLLKDTQVAELFSVSRPTIWRWLQAGILPKPIKLAGSTRWRLSDLEAMVKEREVQG